MQDMERTIERAEEAVKTGRITPETLAAAIEARDQIRAEVAARVAPPDAPVTPQAPGAELPQTGQTSVERALAGQPDDARMTIRDNTIQIQTRVYIYGSGASQQVADDFERQIRQDWGQNPATGAPWIYSDKLIGREYIVNFDVDVRVLNPQDPRAVPLVVPQTLNPWDRNNYIEVISQAEAVSRGTAADPFRAHVSLGDEGVWVGSGPGEPRIAGDRTVSHEFGHLLSFKDRYRDATSNGQTTSLPNRGWETNLMATLNGNVEQRNIDSLVKDYVEIFRVRTLNRGGETSFGLNDSLMRR